VQNGKRSTKTAPQILAKKDEHIVILEAAGLNGVCTDEHLTVTKDFGDTTAYLKAENFVDQIADLLPEEISMIVKAAAYQVLTSNQPVTLSELDFPNGQSVSIAISPFVSGASATRQLLLLFSTPTRNVMNRSPLKPADFPQLTRQHQAGLEEKLASTEHRLELAYAAMHSADENVQSYNEELQSANEEMLSANEELQSVNEELQTVNRQQQQINAELSESNDDLNNYFRSNTNGQLFVDHNLLLKRFSPAAVKHINLRETDIGRPLTHITTNIKFESLIADIQQVMVDGRTITREAESTNGKIYQVMTMPYIRQNTNNADGAIVSFYDITELKGLLAALDISNKGLTESVAAMELSQEKVSRLLEKEKLLNSLKSRFVSMASHEFKTPLTAIQLSAELIGRVALELDHPIVKKYTETIKNAAKNLTNILNDFLSLELLETGRIDPILSEFDLVKFATEITDDMQSLAKRGQQISYRHFGKGRVVTLNPSLLKNSIINLISNAIKYSGTDSLIGFSTRITSSKLTIIISDNGIGIPEEDQKHLFEAFFRAYNTGNIPGTGLGLNIVTRYTALMNGKIRFKSQLNAGTAFTLTFPVRPVI
jgi:signal transduction histidine kinase